MSLARALVLVSLLGGCSPALTITLAHGSASEAASRDQLQRVLAAHDVSRFVHTRTVAIDDDAIPHSHAILTLHTRHLDDDDLLLSTFVHEQAHWWLEAHQSETDAAVAELRAAFPALPVGSPDGAHDERSSYEHLLVDHLEHVALCCAVGDERASAAFAFWETDHYRALYALERTHGADVETILARHGLAYDCE